MIFYEEGSAPLEVAEKISLLKTLDIYLTEVGDAHAVMEVRVGQKHLNYFGGAHGGLIAAIADTVCFFPRPLLPSGRLLTTTNLNINFLRPAGLGDVLYARAEMIHNGRRTVSLHVRVESSDGKLFAHGTATLMVLEPRPSAP